MLNDTYCNVDEIIAESINSGLIVYTQGHYYLTPIGKQLGKYQELPNVHMSNKGKECFLKHVLFNPDLKYWCCGSFLNKFHADTIMGTLVYDRSDNETNEDLKWLMLLNDVGLIQVDPKKAMIFLDHLELVNNFLLKIRNPIVDDIVETSEERNKVGDFAEELALEYEKNRLIAGGFPELAQLVQHISKIDKSAGYDISSFKGYDNNPDSNILIEVKGTKTPDIRFIWSYNERKIAQEEKERYFIYIYKNIVLSIKSAEGPFKIENPFFNIKEQEYFVIPIDVYITKR